VLEVDDLENRALDVDVIPGFELVRGDDEIAPLRAEGQ
jgi:hypothetical protein